MAEENGFVPERKPSILEEEVKEDNWVQIDHVNGNVSYTGRIEKRTDGAWILCPIQGTDYTKEKPKAGIIDFKRIIPTHLIGSVTVLSKSYVEHYCKYQNDQSKNLEKDKKKNETQ